MLSKKNRLACNEKHQCIAISAPIATKSSTMITRDFSDRVKTPSPLMTLATETETEYSTPASDIFPTTPESTVSNSNNYMTSPESYRSSLSPKKSWKQLQYMAYTAVSPYDNRESGEKEHHVTFTGRPSPRSHKPSFSSATAISSPPDSAHMPASLTGFVPHDLLDLTYLDLTSMPVAVQQTRQTGRLPSWIQSCTSLEYLIARNVGLTVIDEWVSEKLTNLRVLRISENNITTWPHHLARLLPYRQLEVIELDGNPCLSTMFQKCPSFQCEYSVAANDYMKPKNTSFGPSSAESITSKKSSKNSSATSKAPGNIINDGEQLFSMKSTGGWHFKKSAKSRVMPSRNADTAPARPKFLAKAPNLSEEKEDQEYGMMTPETENGSDDEDLLTSLNPQPFPLPKIHRKPSSDSTFYGLSRLRSHSSSTSPARMGSVSSRMSSKTGTSIASPRTSANTSISSTATSIFFDRNSSNMGTSDTSNFFNVNLVDKWANQQITDSDAQKFGLTMRLLQDIHELTMGQCIERTEERPFFQGRAQRTSLTSIQGKTAANLDSFKIFQHDGNDVWNSPHAKTNANYESSENPDQYTKSSQLTHNVLYMVEDFVEREMQFVAKMVEFFKIYKAKNKYNKRISSIMCNLPEVYQLHADVVCPALVQALNRIRQGQDPELTGLSATIKAQICKMGIYTQYALTVEESLKKCRLWLRLRPFEYTPASTMLSMAQPHSASGQHPDCDIAEWVKDNMRCDHHSLPSIVDYVQLPLVHLKEWQQFLDSLKIKFPAVSPVSETMKAFVADINRRRPLMAYLKRREEIMKVFRLDTRIYGDFICDSGISLKQQVVLEDISVGNKNADVIHKTTIKLPDGSVRWGPTPKSVKTTIFHAMDTRNATLRLLVFARKVLLVDDNRGQVIEAFDKETVKATTPWPLTNSNGMCKETFGDSSDLRSVRSKRSMETMGTTSSATAMSSPSAMEQIRIMFKGTLEIWYCSLKSYHSAENLEDARITDARDYLIYNINSSSF